MEEIVAEKVPCEITVMGTPPDQDGRYFAQMMENRERETRITLILNQWKKTEPPPCPVLAKVEYGHTVYLSAPEEMEEADFHKFLAWVVRMSGKKFFRYYDSSWEEFRWSNNPWIGVVDVPIGNREFVDAIGEFPVGITIKNAPWGNCKMVEKTVTKTVRQPVCDSDKPLEVA